MGLRFRKNVSALPGKPDVVFPRQRLVVFCDGDFWHGRDWDSRAARLRKGHNASYWLKKIQANRDRDHRHTLELKALGWQVLRLWETDILKDPREAAQTVQLLLERIDADLHGRIGDRA
jgi:DNA mismatch endonuclease (patch repair protein)